MADQGSQVREGGVFCVQILAKLGDFLKNMAKHRGRVHPPSLDCACQHLFHFPCFLGVAEWYILVKD